MNAFKTAAGANYYESQQKMEGTHRGEVLPGMVFVAEV
jgi:hypothetical protein